MPAWLQAWLGALLGCPEQIPHPPWLWGTLGTCVRSRDGERPRPKPLFSDGRCRHGPGPQFQLVRPSGHGVSLGREAGRKGPARQVFVNGLPEAPLLPRPPTRQSHRQAGTHTAANMHSPGHTALHAHTRTFRGCQQMCEPSSHTHR